MPSPLRVLTTAVLVTAALGACDPAGPTGPVAPTENSAPTAWLYELRESGSAVGQTGTVRTVRVGEQAYPESTSFWVGCDGEAAVTTFRLGGTYTGLTGAWALDEETPAGIAVEVRLAADGKELDKRTLTAGGEVAPFTHDLTGSDALELTAEAVEGECAPSPYGYGLLLDAAVQ